MYLPFYLTPSPCFGFDSVTVQSTLTESSPDYTLDIKLLTQLRGRVMDELKKSMH